MLCHNGSTIPGTGRLFFLMIVVCFFLFLSSSFVVWWLFFVCVLWCVGFSGCSCCGSFVVRTVVFI